MPRKPDRRRTWNQIWHDCPPERRSELLQAMKKHLQSKARQPKRPPVNKPRRDTQ